MPLPEYRKPFEDEGWIGGLGRLMHAGHISEFLQAEISGVVGNKDNRPSCMLCLVRVALSAPTPAGGEDVSSLSAARDQGRVGELSNSLHLGHHGLVTKPRSNAIPRPVGIASKASIAASVSIKVSTHLWMRWVEIAFEQAQLAETGRARLVNTGPGDESFDMNIELYPAMIAVSAYAYALDGFSGEPTSAPDAGHPPVVAIPKQTQAAWQLVCEDLTRMTARAPWLQ